MARVGMPPSWHPQRGARRADAVSESGFGLIELIVALTVFSIIVGGLVVTTVAETQLEILTNLECDAVQGFLLARPASELLTVAAEVTPVA